MSITKFITPNTAYYLIIEEEKRQALLVNSNNHPSEAFEVIFTCGCCISPMLAKEARRVAEAAGATAIYIAGAYRRRLDQPSDPFFKDIGEMVKMFDETGHCTSPQMLALEKELADKILSLSSA